MAGNEVGYYTLPVILSFDGVDKQVNGKLGKAFEGVGKKASKELGDGMKSAAADVDKLAESYSKLKDKAADALGKVRADEASLKRLRDTGASDDRVVKAEERLATSRRNSARASREAESGHKSLLSAQKELGDGTDDLGRRFGGLADFAGTAGRALGAAGAVAGGAALAGVAALGTGLVLAGRQLYDLGAQFDDVFDELRLKTGATGPALKELENATERISTKVPLAIGDIGSVVAETSRAFKGLNPTDFDDLVSHVANLGRLTGEDVNVRNLGKAFRIMGVEVKDQVPTLDAFFRANEASGIGVNELIGIVNRGGAQLKQFGLDMGSSAALVGSFEEAGVDASKVIPALNTALKNFAKAGTDPRQGLNDTITQIKALADAGNETGALDLANKIFGAKGGVAFAEVIKSGNLDLQTLNDTLSSTGDTIDAAAGDTDDWAERWQTFKNTVEVALQPLGSGVFDVVNTQLAGLADWVTAHQPEIIGFFTQVGLAAVSMAEFVIKSTGLFAQGLGELIAPIGDVLGGILKAGAALQRLGGHDDVAKEWNDQAESLFGLGEGLYAFGEKAKNFSTADVYDDIKKYGDRAQEAAKFTVALGDATAALPDGHTITISDNSPETIANLRAIGIEVVQTPTGLEVTATTDEAKRVLDAFRDQQAGTPINPPVRPDLGQADADMKSFFDRWKTQVTTPAPAGAQPPRSTGELLLPGYVPPRATGGIYNVWDSVASFANGKLPSQATIQNPVGGAGLVQWAEPSTGGEAFIPLNGGERSRKIWAETGRRLMKFETGGIRGIDALYNEAQSLMGTKYSMSAGDDCSGTMSQLVNATLGLSPKTDRMSTMTAAQWLSKKGAVPGAGPPGTFRLGWKNGGPGGGHMAGTLPDGTHVEMGGANGGYTLGGNAKGADDPSFTDHAYLPIEALYPDGYGSSSGVNPYGSGGSSSGGGSSSSSGTPGIGPNGESGTYSSPDEKTVREADERVTDADQRVKEAEAKQRELKADAKDSEKLSAQADVDKAKREAADARADAAEAKKGKFTAGAASGGGSSVGGNPQDLVSILGGGILETFGLDGSLFPDLSNLAPVKALGTILGAFTGGGEGGGSVVSAGATSSSPFGIPEVAAPPPPGSPASGSGLGPLPGPAGPTTVIDQSIHGNVGESFDQVQKKRDAGLARAIPRIPVGS